MNGIRSQPPLTLAIMAVLIMAVVALGALAYSQWEEARLKSDARDAFGDLRAAFDATPTARPEPQRVTVPNLEFRIMRDCGIVPYYVLAGAVSIPASDGDLWVGGRLDAVFADNTPDAYLVFLVEDAGQGTIWAANRDAGEWSTCRMTGITAPSRVTQALEQTSTLFLDERR
jgi:hypothetical protein